MRNGNRQGFVASLAHPGGNVTGFSNYDPLMVGKWLGMLTQVTPPVSTVAALYSPATTPYAPLLLHAIEEAAPLLAVAARAAPVKDETEIEAMMAGLACEERSGLLVLPDIFNNAHRDAIVALAARYRLGRALRSTEGCQKKAPAYFTVVNKNRRLVCRQPKPNQVILLLHGPQPAPPRRRLPPATEEDCMAKKAKKAKKARAKKARAKK
jgi:hypothetical protein